MPTDPSQNFIARAQEPLDPLFHPRSIAVIGAKDDLGTVGRTVMANLLNDEFKGKVYPVNPKRAQVYGTKAYPSIASIPEKVDLAVIITPAKRVPQVMQECVDAGVRAAIVISAGFKEIGPEGLAMEQELVRIARSGAIPVVGPNCLGIMNPLNGLNATFAKGMALPGSIAFISQSGAMCTAVLDWSFREKIGFSAFVSIGSMADLDWGDLIHYLGDDPNTRSILIYMETVGDSRSFMTAAREIALEKPIIVIKGGRSPDAAKAAASHTGSLAGSDEVFDAALARAGVLRVDSISELFDMAAVLARQPLPRGPRLAILTNAGGPSVLATDATALNGAAIAQLSPETIGRLNQVLPDAWSHSNPVDILGDAGPERYQKSLEILARDEGIDGVLVVLSPQDMTDPTGTAEALKKFGHLPGKPILASWMGGEFVEEGIKTLTKAQIPTFEYPDDAAWAFATMWRYSENLKNLYETPSALEIFLDDPERSAKVQTLLERARQAGQTLLDEFDSKMVLAAYGIPVVETKIATSAEQAEAFADQIGYPAVVKLFSKTITHKSDVGGVILNLKNREEVRAAYKSIEEAVSAKIGRGAFDGVTVQQMVKLEGYELILGCSSDVQFGPVLLFGMGGQLVEIFKDRALGLPPLNMNLALKLMEKTKIFEALKGVRGRKAIDIQKLAQILVQFSVLIVENPWIKELDINPLLVSPDEMIALDARIVLQEQYEPLISPAIRPYPTQYIRPILLRDGINVLLRPIKAEDEPLVVEFHKELSENSVRQRYFEFLSLDERTTHDRLIRICFNDYDQEIALIALIEEKGHQKIAGIARLSRISGLCKARMTMTIADPYHGRGLGKQLLGQLIEIAKQEKMGGIEAEILAENSVMIHLCEGLGFKIQERPDANPLLIYAELKLS